MQIKFPFRRGDPCPSPSQLLRAEALGLQQQRPPRKAGPSPARRTAQARRGAPHCPQMSHHTRADHTWADLPWTEGRH